MIIYLLEELKKQKKLMIPSPGEHVKQMELAYIADGNKKWRIALENSLAVV